MNLDFSGTMIDGVINNTIPNPNGGFSSILIPTTYLPVGNFNDFIVIPLNGTWTITVTDNLFIDNGRVFSWDLSFANDSTELYYNFDGSCINDLDSDAICDEIEFPGCTDNLACNFDPLATDDNESCFYAELYFDCNGNCVNDIDLDGECYEIDNCLEVVNSDQEDTDNDGEGDACDYDDGLGLIEFGDSSLKLIRMIDFLGREYEEHESGILLFYIYDNGRIEKKFIY